MANLSRGTLLGMILACVAALVLLVGTGAMIAMKGSRQTGDVATVSIGGPFVLTSQTGKKVSSDALKGSPFAVFFGFTHCPEVCPTTLWEMSEALKQLGPDAEKLRVFFISIDPTRDTPEVMAHYLQSFDDRITALTGTEEEIDTVGKAYRAYWKKIPTDDGDYTMDHTTSIYLMDSEGSFSGTITYQEDPKVRLEKLRRLIAKGTG